MGMGCIFQNFAFGIPWDGAYEDCCLATQPFTTSPAHVTSPTTLASSKDKKTTIIPTPGKWLKHKRHNDKVFITCNMSTFTQNNLIT